jgi:hypothetical protein
MSRYYGKPPVTESKIYSTQTEYPNQFLISIRGLEEIIPLLLANGYCLMHNDYIQYGYILCEHQLAEKCDVTHIFMVLIDTLESEGWTQIGHLTLKQIQQV